MNKPTKIIIHGSDLARSKRADQFNAINAYHKSQDFPISSLGFYIGYHRLITGGMNYKCKEDWEDGAHANEIVNGKSLNIQSLGVCVGFDGDIELLTTEEVIMLRTQVQEWQRAYNIPNSEVYFHRDFAPWKTCPGSLIKKDLLKTVCRFEVSPTDKEKVLNLIKGKVPESVFNLIASFLS